MVNKLNQLKNQLLNIRKYREIITIHELADYILKTGCVPTPAYSKSQEYGYIISQLKHKMLSIGKDREIITTHELADYILKTGCVPPSVIYVKKNIKRRTVDLK